MSECSVRPVMFCALYNTVINCLSSDVRFEAFVRSVAGHFNKISDYFHSIIWLFHIQGDFECKYPMFVSKQSSLSRLRQWLLTPSNLQMPFSNVMNPKPTEFFAQNTYCILLSL